MLGARAELVPVQESHPAVVAYLRQKPDGAALVVANLSEDPLPGVSLSVDASVLPPDSDLWFPEMLLGDGRPSGFLEVEADGGFVDYEPLEVLEPLTAYVVGLSGPD